MKYELIDFELIQVALDIFFFVLALWCIHHLKNYRRMVQVMTSRSAAVATDPALIEEWYQTWKSLPPDTPRWIAYKNRLIEVKRIKPDEDDDGD